MRAAKIFGTTALDAEDIAQEAMIRLVPSLPDIERPEAALFVIVRHLVADQRRRRSIRARLRTELTRDTAEFGSPLAAWCAEVDVSNLFAGLNPRTRQLLELLLAGYKHREIAALLGCEVHQVGPRIHRALETARRHLAESADSSSSAHR